MFAYEAQRKKKLRGARERTRACIHFILFKEDLVFTTYIIKVTMTSVSPSSSNSVLTAMDVLLSNPKKDETTCLSLHYFNEDDKADEKELTDVLGSYRFSNFKQTRFTLNDNGKVLSEIFEDGYTNISFTTCDVTFGDVTLSNVPTRFFRITKEKNFIYTLANGVAIQFSNVYGENFIKGEFVGAEGKTVELQTSGKSYQNVDGDDVGSSMMNVVNSFLTPQKSPCIRFSYVGNGIHPLPASAKHTIIIIPYVKKLYVTKTVKRLRSGRKKVEYGGIYTTYTYGVRRYEKEKCQYGPLVTVENAILKRMEPLCRYGHDFSREVRGNGRVRVTEEYAIHLCNDSGSSLLRVCQLVGRIDVSDLKSWMESLFTHVEFGGFVKSYNDVPGL